MDMTITTVQAINLAGSVPDALWSRVRIAEVETPDGITLVAKIPDDVSAQILAYDKNDAKPRLRAYAAAKRWDVQTSGVAWSGQTVPTTDDARSTVAQAIQSIDIGILAAPVGWKLPNGFSLLTRAQIVEMAQAMTAHVQAAFTAEASAVAAIMAGSITTQEQIDAEFEA